MSDDHPDPYAEILAPLDAVLARLAALSRDRRCLVSVDEMIDAVVDARVDIGRRFVLAELERSAQAR